MERDDASMNHRKTIQFIVIKVVPLARFPISNERYSLPNLPGHMKVDLRMFLTFLIISQISKEIIRTNQLVGCSK